MNAGPILWDDKRFDSDSFRGSSLSSQSSGYLSVFSNSSSVTNLRSRLACIPRYPCPSLPQPGPLSVAVFSISVLDRSGLSGARFIALSSNSAHESVSLKRNVPQQGSLSNDPQ